MELLKTENDVAEPQKQLMEVTKIEDTPFTMVRYEDQFFVALGKYRISPILKSAEECIEDTKNTSWERLMTVMNVMIIEHDNERLNVQPKEDNNNPLNK